MTAKEHWLSVAEAAAACGVTTRGFSPLRSLVPPEHTKVGKKGTKTMLSVAGIILAVREQERARRRLLADPVRRQRDKLRVKRESLQLEAAKLDLATRRGEIIQRSEVRDIFSLWASALRAVRAKWTRRAGPELGEDIDRMLTQAAGTVHCSDGRSGLDAAG